MRSRVWGLQLSLLLLFTLIPMVFWLLFRWQDQSALSFSSFWYYSHIRLITSGAIYVAISLFWMYFLRRGLFQARIVPYVLITLQVAYELVNAVSSRDFGRMSASILLLFVGILLFRWMEKQVGSASLNPEISWYEGVPKTIPHLEARISIQDAWYKAKVRKIDREGAFFVIEDWPDTTLTVRSRAEIPLKLKFKDHEVEAIGKVKSVFLTGLPTLGIGLQFLAKDLYHLSEYTALVENVAAEGLSR